MTPHARPSPTVGRTSRFVRRAALRGHGDVRCAVFHLYTVMIRYALLLLLGSSTALAQTVDPLRILTAPVPDPYDAFGAWVDAVSDVDGDGSADLVVASPGASGYGSGCVALVTSTGTLEGQVCSPNFRINGGFGSVAAFVGDINGDFRREALVGAPGETSSVGGPVWQGGDGRAYVLAGGSGDVLFSLVSPNADTSGSNYFTGSFGSATAGPGDVTGDGVPDFVVGAKYEKVGSAHNAGRAYVFSGADGSLVRTLLSPTPQFDGSFGSRIEAVSDLDGDGVSDLVIAAERETPAPNVYTDGRVHVFSGATGALLFSLDSGIELSIPAMNGELVEAGDLNDDGLTEIAVGGPSAGDHGVVFLFSGADGTLFRTLEPNLGTEPPASFGAAIAPVGDVDGDGVPDLFVGAPFAYDAGVGAGAGRAFLMSGSTGAILLSFTSSHPRLNGRFGLSVAWADIDGDGGRDAIVGAPFEALSAGEPPQGLVYLYTQTALRAAVGNPVTGEPVAPGPALALGVARPHPVSGRGEMQVTLGEAGTARLGLYDALGRRVGLLADGPFAAGTHTVPVDASRLAPGVYVVRLEAAGRVTTRRLVVTR